MISALIGQLHFVLFQAEVEICGVSRVILLRQCLSEVVGIFNVGKHESDAAADGLEHVVDDESLLEPCDFEQSGFNSLCELYFYT